MASEIRNRFTDTEMQIARETDLPDLLSHLGYQVKRVGRFHTTTEMDSLRIKDRRTWFRYSQNTGGDAITFLQQFCGKSFPEAVEYLLTFHGKARDAPIPQPKPISPKQEFSLPLRNADDRRVFAYLRKRGIAAQVIRQFLKLDCCMRMRYIITASSSAGMNPDRQSTRGCVVPMIWTAPASRETQPAATKTQASPSRTIRSQIWCLSLRHPSI